MSDTQPPPSAPRASQQRQAVCRRRADRAPAAGRGTPPHHVSGVRNVEGELEPHDAVRHRRVPASAPALRCGARNPVRKARSSPTALGDTMIGAAAAKETVDSIAGHPARDTPFAAALIALAMTVYGFRAATKRLLHAVRPSFRHVVAAEHRVRAVMRRWGISPSSIQMSPGANTGSAGDRRERRTSRPPEDQRPGMAKSGGTEPLLPDEAHAA